MSLVFFVCQVFQALDEEVLEQAQCEGLAPRYRIQQGQECLYVVALQHCRQ